MHFKIYSTHNEVPEGQLKGKNVIIIDVLRATSVITTALANGAKKVMTSPSIKEALARKAANPNLILGGERNAIKIKGFDLGNSPLEYTRERVADKTILLSSTNGTQAVKKALGAKKIIAASFLNLNVVVEYLEKLNEDLNVICSGTNGEFSLDDGLCVGLILYELRKKITVSTDDFGELLTLPFIKDSFSIKNLLSNAYHVNFLNSKGFSTDVDYCLDINVLEIIPIWESDGFIIIED